MIGKTEPDARISFSSFSYDKMNPSLIIDSLKQAIGRAFQGGGVRFDGNVFDATYKGRHYEGYLNYAPGKVRESRGPWDERIKVLELAVEIGLFFPGQGSRFDRMFVSRVKRGVGDNTASNAS